MTPYQNFVIPLTAALFIPEEVRGFFNNIAGEGLSNY